MSEKTKKPFFKRWWFWLLAVVIVGAIGASSGNKGSQANEQIKSASSNNANSPEPAKEQKPKLTLDDGWTIDKSNPYMTKAIGTVSNNTAEAVDHYVQITFSALDASGANVGDCLANVNTIDANGKWKFEAICSGNNIETVRFKEITGF